VSGLLEFNAMAAGAGTNLVWDSEAHSITVGASGMYLIAFAVPGVENITATLRKDGTADAVLSSQASAPATGGVVSASVFSVTYIFAGTVLTIHAAGTIPANSLSTWTILRLS
jgi:hypothetical protein